MEQAEQKRTFFQAQKAKGEKQAAKLNAWLNKNYKIGVISVFVLVLAVGLFWLVYPKYQSLKQQTSKSLPDKIEELRVLEDYAAKIKELEQAIANWQTKNRQQVQTLEQVLPDTPKVPELIAQFDALARESGFLVNSFDFAESEATLANAAVVLDAPRPKAKVKKTGLEHIKLDKDIRLVNITLNLTGGDYLSFKKFLDRLEKNMRLLDVVSIDFSSSLAQGTDYNIALRTYYLISPETAYENN